MNLITITDFAGIVPFSVNIGAHLADPHIADAQALDVLPRLPAALRTVLATPTVGWPADVTTLFTDHLKRVLVLEAARRMLLWHGLHITPNGCENTAALPITDAQRNQLRADLAAKAGHYWPALLSAAGSLYPAATTGCGTGTRRARTGSTTAAL